ncbi:MAG: Kae1-associated kinase Bud32 [Candidatus Bathyarchaeota archaeon]|jgi:TP53 regulating kinase-like protein|nr:Kae1-associated kinase Bud32 [Candidatus Bathyarchaeota archaeon]
MDRLMMPQLVKKGAEASLFLADWHGRKVIIKKRLPKKYRHARLDEQIKTYRTVHEPQLMHMAKKAGVPTPTIFFVDVKNSIIVMEFIEGKQLKQVLNNVSSLERQRLCKRIGELVGRLHKQGIIHGDLTTSNMILDPRGSIVFVDFGLGEASKELEAKGVDLHLMRRALQSTHFAFAEECFNSIAKGYASVVGEDAAKDVLDKIGDIGKRGRYVTRREEDNGD